MPPDRTPADAPTVNGLAHTLRDWLKRLQALSLPHHDHEWATLRGHVQALVLLAQTSEATRKQCQALANTCLAENERLRRELETANADAARLALRVGVLDLLTSEQDVPEGPPQGRTP